MGPPREHGGMTLDVELYLFRIVASMGPPREHGGMSLVHSAPMRVLPLQWGRRVNTAECRMRQLPQRRCRRFNGAAA